MVDQPADRRDIEKVINPVDDRDGWSPLCVRGQKSVNGDPRTLIQIESVGGDRSMSPGQSAETMQETILLEWGHPLDSCLLTQFLADIKGRGGPGLTQRTVKSPRRQRRPALRIDCRVVVDQQLRLVFLFIRTLVPATG